MDYKPQIGGKQCSSPVSPLMEGQVQRLRGQDWHSTQSVDVTIIIINNDFVILHHVPRFMMRFIDIFGACADSVYQALLFPPPREARASPYAGKIGTGDEAK